jgi:hypothetical protein
MIAAGETARDIVETNAPVGEEERAIHAMAVEAAKRRSI